MLASYPGHQAWLRSGPLLVNVSTVSLLFVMPLVIQLLPLPDLASTIVSHPDISSVLSLCTRIRLLCTRHSSGYFQLTLLACHLKQLLLCTGLVGGEAPGNPTFFAGMVQFVGRGGPQLSDQQQQHIINWVCQGAILMDTEAAADKYRDAVTGHRRQCPHLVCKDTGSLIRSGGSIRIGYGATAPRSIQGMALCLAAPPVHMTAAYRRCKTVLNILAPMEQLLQRLSEAQVNAVCWQGSTAVMLGFTQYSLQHAMNSSHCDCLMQ